VTMPRELFRRMEINKGMNQDMTNDSVKTFGSMGADQTVFSAKKKNEMNPMKLDEMGSREERQIEETNVQRVLVPQQIRSGSLYRQLMTSHDRMSTRHVKG